MNQINLIAIHCSATPNGRPVTAEDIHRWHQERGWDGIGYHYVIEVDGAIRTGRPQYWRGAHVAGHNSGSIGICLIGTDFFTNAQHEALEELLHDIRDEHNDAAIRGHRDLSPDADGDGEVERHEWLKTCPGIDVETWCKARGINPR